MKKLKIVILAILFFALCLNIFGQKKTNAFEVKIRGHGKTSIIFIPGFACSGDVWNETTSICQKDYTCYTLTMAGFAGVAPQADARFANWEKSIADYIIENKIKKTILIGHSMGGGLALAIAADYPGLISKIIVVDALPCLSALMNPNFKSVENPDCTAVTNKIATASREQFYLMQKKSIPGLLKDSSMSDTVVNWSVLSDRKTFVNMYCDFSNTDLREKIKSVNCPALILLENYFANAKPLIEDQYKNLKNANLQYATKGLHFIMFDDKDWYFNQLTNFLNQK